MLGLPFREIWCIDFEFIAREGENPEPESRPGKWCAGSSLMCVAS
jgi:hypothetical protein